MKEKEYKLIRYADDFIVMCKDETEAQRAYELSIEILEGQLGLRLHELNGSNLKTRIVNPTKEHFSFLSVAFDGCKIFPSRKSVDDFIKGIERLCYVKSEARNVLTMLSRIRNSIDGWVSTYSYTDVERYFEEIDSVIGNHLFRGLNNFDWKLKKVDKVKAKFRTRNEKTSHLNSGSCLSKQQRINSGVPLCIDILVERRKPKLVEKFDNPSIAHL